MWSKSFQSTTSLPGKKREATRLPSLHLIQMEYFRRLVGALQETLDYVSSFTTYLLGDETHPGAEESGRSKELQRRSSRHDSEVETAAHSGDVSPQGYLDAFERPFPTEVTLFNQEICVASEAVVIDAQATEAIPEPSKSAYKCEGQEVAGQKLSEITDNWKRDLEELALIQGLHPWEPEEATLIEEIQQEGLEEVGLDTGSSPHCKPDRPLAGGNREGEQNEAGRTDGAQQRELEGTVRTEEIEQRTDWALPVAEQPSGLKGAVWTGETEHGRLKELAKMAESQHLEEEEDSATETEGDQQRGTNEGIQQAMLERAETEGNQEGVLEEVDRIYQHEPVKTVMTFEEQDPKWVAEERNSYQSGLERATDTEDHQQGELEGPLRNEAWAKDKQQEEPMYGVWEGTSERLVEEEEDLEELLEKTETRGIQSWEREWTERSRQDKPTGSRASLDMYLFGGDQIDGEPEKLTEELEEIAAVVVLEEAEAVRHQPQEPEMTERSLQKEPTGSRASPDMCLYAGGAQVVGEPEKPTEKLEEEQEIIVEVVTVDDEKTSGYQPREPEGTERKLHEEAMESRASLDTCLFGGELITGESEKLAEIVAVVLEEAETGGHQPWEPEVTEKSLHEEPMGSRASLDAGFFDGEQIVQEPKKMIEEVAVIVQEEAETGGHQSWEPEGGLHEEPKGSNGTPNMCLFGGEQIVGEPEKLTEEQEEASAVMLEEAANGRHQPQEPERTERGLQQEPTGSRVSPDMYLYAGRDQMGEPEKLTEQQEEIVTVVVLEEVETGGHQPWKPDEPERRLNEEPMGSRAPFDTCLFDGEKTVEEPEVLTEVQDLVEGVVLEEAETGEGQPWESEGPEKSLHEEPTGSRAYPDEHLFTEPSTFPDEVLPLDTSAQKERVLLRRKSSIRRAPSLKKPKLPTETQPPPANLTEAVPPPSQAPRQPNLRHTGFGPMHPNMMAELQMRLRRPQ
ncbi:apolipoprotein B receptor [Tiliqua scincoides]|uniref:apolipoprotein B receptor n=1 Tax=Tiliqua scincoides TaxID=71010 RepID=UPI00346192C5